MNKIVTAELSHALSLAGRLKAADVAEIKATSGDTPEDALVLSLALSPTAYTWLHNDEPVAMFGVSPMEHRPGVGIPWLLTSPEALKHSTFLLRNSAPYVREFLRDYPYLENHVDCRNTASIQWLAWLGFAMCEVRPFYGAQRLPFIRFAMAR